MPGKPGLSKKACDGEGCHRTRRGWVDVVIRSLDRGILPGAGISRADLRLLGFGHFDVVI
jgi:hypothetical protein